jgi:hypothetical protein
MRTYHPAPDKFDAARKRLFWQRGSLFAGIAVFLIFFQYKQFGDTWRHGSIISLLPLAVVILFLLSSIAYSFMKAQKREQEVWSSWELILGEDFLIRRIKGFPEMEIRRDEITALKESDAGLRVETNSRDRVIVIAPALVDYQDARARVSLWMVPVQQTQHEWLSPARWMVVLPLLVLLLFGSFFLATRSYVVVATGIPLLGILAWSVLRIQRSAQLGANLKRSSLMIFFPLLAIVARLVISIVNWH